MEWSKVLSKNYNFGVLLKTIPRKGNMVYEYNPLRNYRLDKDMFEYKGILYTEQELDEKYLIELLKYLYNDQKYSSKEDVENAIEEYNNTNSTNHTFEENVSSILEWNIEENEEKPLLREKGELVDFVTNLLKFSINHPVNIIPLYSYDGSVNLILNDGYSSPKLINSRFSTTGLNTYEIIDRTGNNDTNIYDQGDEFDLDTSLYKKVISIPKITYNGTYSGGNLKVGNYFFYFKLSDADGNETDFIGESSLVSIFIGNTPRNIHTGQRDENSLKSISFTITNIDSSYDYMIVYYSRTTAERELNPVTEYVRIDKKFPLDNVGNCNLLITGLENLEQVSAADININYNIVDNAKTQAVCLNMLFLGNVHKPEIPYNELQDLSLRILPYLKEEQYQGKIDENYILVNSESSYYDSKFIYYKTGYWGEELYRFGIVYILNNGELTPTFNVRGGVIGTSSNDYSNIPVYDDEGSRKYISYDEKTFEIYSNDKKISNENIKGVVKFTPTTDTDTIYGVNFYINKDVLEELKKYVKGFFFVRQTRIPTILAQGVTVGIDKISKIPCIPTASGTLDIIKNQLSQTHVTTKDINDVNYISEGFLHRYSFEFKKKSSSIWSKLGKIGTIVGIIAATAAVVFTAGALAPAYAAAVAGGLTAIEAAAAVTLAETIIVVGTGVSGVAAGVVWGATGAVIHDWSLAVKRKTSAPFRLDGRNTKAPEGYKIVEANKSRKLTLDFNNRIIIKDPDCVKIQGIICPDYEVNQAYYNSIFTGNLHKITLTKSLSTNMLDTSKSYTYFTNLERHFYFSNYFDNESNRFHFTKIIGVPDSAKAIGLSNLIYRARAGYAEEAWKYEDVGISFKNENIDADDKILEVEQDKKIINSDIIRGNFGAYLAIDSEELNPAEIVNIYVSGFENLTQASLFSIRYNDNSPYYSISDRISISDVEKLNKNLLGQDISDHYEFTCYRGDCYICQFTHRLNRNFNDPAAPYNDEIVDPDTWKSNYDPNNQEKYSKINLGDINSILLGMWITFKIRSSNNLNIRTLDGSNLEESTMVQHKRGFYPYYPMTTEGTYKHPDSYLYNKGFLKSVGDKWNNLIPDVPHIKNWFGTRIMYSDIHINDAFKNGFRIFLANNYRDYTREYGEIIKLISVDSNLLCVFEHGIALIPVNERALVGNGSGGNIFINTSNVLPENPKIISDMYGSLFADSIIKTPNYVYGLDTVAKKIWRTNGNDFEIISDFKVQEFLNNNITLTERETKPIIGIRNVKTFYNAFKQDVMFTYYDNLYGFEEKAWNLCFNETLNKFITFYSWVPSMMENIDNIPFSFDRNTSKYISKLGISNINSLFAEGITLSNNVIKKGETEIGILSLTNRNIPTGYKIKYELLSDNDIFKIDDKYKLCLKNKSNYYNLCSELYYRNKEENKISYKKLGINNIVDNNYPIFKDITGKRLTLDYQDTLNSDKIVKFINIRAIIYKSNSASNIEEEYYNLASMQAGYYESIIGVITEWNKQFLTTDFWKHGQSGIIDIKDEIYPTYWYGKQHPFEFEVIVVNDPATHKIFTNLEIVSNKAEPESFHYEIIGECYDFAKDKPNMYYRQEAMKKLWKEQGGLDITYNRKYTNTKLLQQSKSADLIKTYYARQDTINDIENYYVSKDNADGFDYRHLSGAEIIYYKNRQEYRIGVHSKAIVLNNEENSLLSSNCRYLEDRWKVSINPILVCYKNEEKWEIPPYAIFNSPIPNLDNTNIEIDDLNTIVDVQPWGNRQELDLKDKFLKVKIRYSGKELAIIDFLNTVYRISYA